MRRYLTASSSQGNCEFTPTPSYHPASSRRLGQYIDPSHTPSSPTYRFRLSQYGFQPLSPPLLPSPSPIPHEELSHEYPSGEWCVQGTRFNVDFNHVYRKNQRLNPSRLGYAVKHISILNGRRTPSDIWRFGVQLKYKEDNGSYTKLWLCQICHQNHERSDAFNYNGTAHIATHIEKVHKIDPHTGDTGPEDVPLPSTPFSATAQVPGSASTLSRVLSEEDSFQEDFIDWVVINNISCDDATAPSTRGLLTWNREHLLHVLPSSADTMSSYINKHLEERKRVVANLLKSSSSKVSVSVERWTSSNHLSFLSVVAHFTDANYRQRDLLIAFRNLFGDNTSTAQALIILEVILEYDFELKFNCIVGDSATSNDAKLINTLNDRSLTLQLNTRHQIDCVGHIINLVVKATLYGTEVSSFEDELARAAPQRQFELYRRHGVIGKLHNLVKALCSSHKRHDLFQSCFGDTDEDDPLWELAQLQPLKDDVIRWYSTYMMALRCKDLRPAITRFQEKYREYVESETAIDDGTYSHVLDTISDDDWDKINNIIDFLQVPYDLIKHLESSNHASGFGSLWQTIIYLQTLWVHYNSASDGYADSEDCYLKSSVSCGLDKLSSYWLKLIINPNTSSYCVATALHPRLRLTWFKDHWRHYENWHMKAERSVEKVYREYLAAETEPDETVVQPRRRKVPASRSTNTFAAIMEVGEQYLVGSKSHKKNKHVSQLQEYFDDLYEDSQRDESYQKLMAHPWQWWLKIGRAKYPIVFKMAADFLSIPSTSCECEHCFSSAKKSITYDQSQLSSSTIEAIQLQKNWLKNRAVSGSLTKLADDIEREQRREIRAESGENTSF